MRWFQGRTPLQWDNPDWPGATPASIEARKAFAYQLLRDMLEGQHVNRTDYGNRNVHTGVSAIENELLVPVDERDRESNAIVTYGMSDTERHRFHHDRKEQRDWVREETQSSRFLKRLRAAEVMAEAVERWPGLLRQYPWLREAMRAAGERLLEVSHG